MNHCCVKQTWLTGQKKVQIWIWWPWCNGGGVDHVGVWSVRMWHCFLRTYQCYSCLPRHIQYILIGNWAISVKFTSIRLAMTICIALTLLIIYIIFIDRETLSSAVCEMRCFQFYLSPAIDYNLWCILGWKFHYQPMGCGYQRAFNPECITFCSLLCSSSVIGTWLTFYESSIIHFHQYDSICIDLLYQTSISGAQQCVYEEWHVHGWSFPIQKWTTTL